MFWLSQYAHKPGRIAVSARHVVNLPLFAQDSHIVAKPFVGFPWGFGVSWRRGLNQTYPMQPRSISLMKRPCVVVCRVASAG